MVKGLRLETSGHTLTITIDSGEGNLFSPEMMDALSTGSRRPAAVGRCGSFDYEPRVTCSAWAGRRAARRRTSSGAQLVGSSR